MDEARKAFIQERNEIIFSLDKEKILAYFAKTGEPWDENEEEIVFWTAIHKMICNIIDAPEVLVLKLKIGCMAMECVTSWGVSAYNSHCQCAFAQQHSHRRMAGGYVVFICHIHQKEIPLGKKHQCQVKMQKSIIMRCSEKR